MLNYRYITILIAFWIAQESCVPIWNVLGFPVPDEVGAVPGRCPEGVLRVS